MQKKTWTVMIYLAGDNNLSDEMIWALKEMFRVGAESHLKIIVQFDPSALGFAPRRYDIGKLCRQVQPTGDVDGVIELDALREPLVPSSDSSGPANMGAAVSESSADPAVLSDFIGWCLANHETDHYMLILSGHGSGATGEFLQDFNPPGALSIPALGGILRNACHEHLGGKKIDILGLDSCVMSMAEVGHEVSDSVEYMVGAEGFTENVGWPYHRVLELLRNGPGPRKLATGMVEKYYHYYSDYLAAGVSVDLAAIHLGGAWRDSVIRPISILSVSLEKALEKSDRLTLYGVLAAHWESQSYNFEQHTDIYDFCLRLRLYLETMDKTGKSNPVRKACEDLIDNLEQETVVVRSLYSGPEYQHSHGLSIYFPWASVSANYDSLAFSRDTHWDSFLKTYIEKTRREVRVAKKNPDGRLQWLAVPEWLPGLDDPLWSKTGSPHGVKAGSPHGVKTGSPHGVKTGSPHGVRTGTPHSVRTGGLQTVKSLARRLSMKNFSKFFYQPLSGSQEVLEIKKSLEDQRIQDLVEEFGEDRVSTILQSMKGKPTSKKSESGLAGTAANRQPRNSRKSR